MSFESLTVNERNTLLKLARKSIELVVSGKELPEIALSDYPPALIENGASFVTLTIQGVLRGCIGALEAYQPLVQDVCEHAAAAAVGDYRFNPVVQKEVAKLNIEISRLTPLQRVTYSSPGELLEKVRPGVDGVILCEGLMRATYLPQVWEKIPDKTEFLNSLCQKMGAPEDLWLRKKLKVEVYQVEEFHE